MQKVKCGRNGEGYIDPTASAAIGKVVREQKEQLECETDRRAYDLIKVLKYIITVSGFELEERVQIKDIKTGRTYR